MKGWLDKYNDGGPVQENYNDYSVSAGPGFQGDGYFNKGRNYSPAWGGQFAMGGYMPGTVGAMYARTGSIPSKGTHRNTVDKTDASAENGTEMRYYQEGLDWRPRSMADGGVISGVLDPIVNAGKSAVNYVTDLFEDPKPKSAPLPVTTKKVKAVPVKLDNYDTLIQLYDNTPKWDKVMNLWDETEDIYSKDQNRVKLNTGRFRGANVSSKLIDDIAAAAKRNKIPFGQLLTLAGRESTFGEEKGRLDYYSDDKDKYMSGWDVDNNYKPYDPHRFLADKKAPGINVVKNSQGYEYKVVDEKALRQHLIKNPRLLEQYKKKIESTPDLGNKNYFDLSAEFLKKKGIQGYNPGDPRYVQMFNQDYNLLKQDKGLMNYVKQKGYQFEEGGTLQLTKLDQLTNFTNYNTKQPGGWLDKYEG